MTLRDRWTPCTLLTPLRRTDGAGGLCTEWQESGTVKALIIPHRGSVKREGPGAEAEQRVSLIHEPGVVLLPGMGLRLPEGALLLVTGTDRPTPPDAEEPACLNDAERMVHLL